MNPPSPQNIFEMSTEIDELTNAFSSCNFESAAPDTPNVEIGMTELEAVKAELEAVKAELETIKKGCISPVVESYSDDSVYGKLKEIGEQLYNTQKATNMWRNTPLELINELKPDPAGKVGEELLKTICLACGIKNESTGDKNSKDGTYDQKVCDTLKKVEIKTARLGGGKYQHETLKKEGCDYWLFVDIKPDGGCITILPKFDLTNKHPITGTTPSPRKGTTDVFKWDFTENHLNKFVSTGAAIRFDKNTPMSKIGDFIIAKIV
jgi:hypothetical protein